MKPALLASMLSLAVLCACSSNGGPAIRDQPEDMNVSPRSMDAYDPAVRELEKPQN
jgi:hypothetical protein